MPSQTVTDTSAPWPEDGAPRLTRASGDSRKSRDKEVLPTFACDAAFLTSLRPTRPVPTHAAPRAARDVDRLSSALRAALALEKES